MDLSTPGRRHRPTPIPAVLRTAVRGRVVFPTDRGWSEALAAWGLSASDRPHALVTAGGLEDIKATLAYADHHGLGVAWQGAESTSAPPGDLTDLIVLRASTALPQGRTGTWSKTTGPSDLDVPSVTT